MIEKYECSCASGACAACARTPVDQLGRVYGWTRGKLEVGTRLIAFAGVVSAFGPLRRLYSHRAPRPRRRCPSLTRSIGRELAPCGAWRAHACREGLCRQAMAARPPPTRPARCCEHATPSHDLPQETTVAARRGFRSIAGPVPPNSLKAVERAFYNRGCPGRSSSNVRTTVSTTRRTESRRSAELRPASVRRRMFSTACHGCRVLIVVEAFRLT